MENKHLSPKDLNYLNVPYSIINQRWFRSEKAVRAWFFYAWHALFPESGKTLIKTIRKEKFNLKQGEMICTRSYLAKSLGIEDSAAKSSTDRLKRTGTIKVRQEVISKDIEKAPKNKLSRVTVDGVPVPNEPYIKMPLPIKADLFWQEKVLAQIYIYLMCKAEHKEVFGIGTGHSELLLKAGDVLTSYATLIEELRCTEYQIKKYLSYFEKNGIINRQRVGNGILIHLNYYPEKKDSVKKKEELITHVQASTPVNDTPSSTPRTVERKSTPSVVLEGDIKETRVTGAVKYLFFELKGNKDVGHLNQIIAFIDMNLSSDFPIEKLKEAMDEYFAEHGTEYIDKQKLLQSLNIYHTRIKQKQQRLNDNVEKIRSIEKEYANLNTETIRFRENWTLIEKVYNEEFAVNGSIGEHSEKEFSGMYYTLWMANMVGKYINTPELKNGVTPDKRIQYINDFFTHISSYESLVDMRRKEFEKKNLEFDKKKMELEKEYAKLKSEYSELKKAI